jgi:hypothetical protein
MKSITLNLTQHQPTAEQVSAGVINLKEELQPQLKALLNFTDIPTADDLEKTAQGIGSLVYQHLGMDYNENDDSEVKAHKLQFMIGGAPYLMKPLIEELNYLGRPVFSFTERVSVEKEVNGEVIKTSIFKHKGWVEAV